MFVHGYLCRASEMPIVVKLAHSLLPGERSQNAQDLLQEVWQAPTTQSDPVQEGQRIFVCSR